MSRLERSSRSGRWRRRLGTVLAWTTVAVAAIALALMAVPALLGLERYVIESGSMEPTLKVGSVVLDDVVPVDALREGDIITFVPPPEYDLSAPVTHRIHEIEEDAATGERRFRTKGDANDGPDPWLIVFDQDQQPRVVHHIPYVGYIYLALRNGWVQLLLIGLPATFIVVSVSRTLWKLSADEVRQERRARPGGTAGPSGGPPVLDDESLGDPTKEGAR